MDLVSEVLPLLAAQSLPTPSRTWLAAIINGRTPPPPAKSLAATARIRLLAADLTAPGLLDSSYAAEHSFPSSLPRPEVPRARLGRDVVVQVLDIEDIGRSRWEQVEELEAIERGEQTRGREIIRLPTGGEDNNGDGDAVATQALEPPGQGQRANATRQNATHKLVLQDAKGKRMYALELRRMEQLGVGKTNIGEKMLLRSDATVSRGLLLLEPSVCLFLGGKVEAWQKAWVDNRLSQLREAVGANPRRT